MTSSAVTVTTLRAWALHEAPSVFQTQEYLAAWWNSFGRGHLMILHATEGGRELTAPLFADTGMIYLVGSGGSDYLDFQGGPVTDELLVAVLAEARALTRDFRGFCFYHVPESSPTTAALERVAGRLDLCLREEYSMVAPRVDFEALHGAGHPARKKSLLRHEKTLAKSGDLRIIHAHSCGQIMAWLPAFFEQHIERWQGTGSPSLFLDPKQRAFYQALVASEATFLRMTRVEWNDEPAAFHFGFSYRGSYLWYKPSYSTSLARYSPGEVLLRHLLLAAEDEGCRTFDFGLGDEAFKRRFATSIEVVRSWGLYAR